MKQGITSLFFALSGSENLFEKGGDEMNGSRLLLLIALVAIIVGSSASLLLRTREDQRVVEGQVVVVEQNFIVIECEESTREVCTPGSYNVLRTDTASKVELSLSQTYRFTVRFDRASNQWMLLQAAPFQSNPSHP